jgi:uncharacterized protein YkwD
MIRIVLFILLLAGPAAAQSCKASDATAALVAAANTLREASGARPLKASPLLARVAAAHVCDIARRGSLDHKGSDGSTIKSRIARGGCRATLSAENLAWGYADAAAVLAGWKGSPPHRRNLVASKATAAGAARAEVGGKVWWVMDFAAGC